MAQDKQDQLFPEIEAYESGMLQVSDLHRIYWEQSGNKDGKPVLFVHGGPGASSSPTHRRFFDPEVYRIVLFDQRGAGKSEPSAEIKENTTWDLVNDMEKLRKHLHIDKWVVFGGSWGSCLSLIYAIKHPDRVKALILRGIFTHRRWELTWYNQSGAEAMFPEEFEKYLEPIPEVERGDLISAYHRRLVMGDDEEEKIRCARAFSHWENVTSQLLPEEEEEEEESDISALQAARIESHYFVNGGFLPKDNYILANVDKIRHIPCTIVQGRYDIPCPVTTAWELKKKFPEAELHIVPDAGHSSKEPGIMKKLLKATEKYKAL